MRVICARMAAFLDEHPAHVAAVHCKVTPLHSGTRPPTTAGPRPLPSPPAHVAPTPTGP